LNRLSRAHERYRQTDDRQTTDRQTTDGRTIAYSEREREFTFANKTGATRGHMSPVAISPASYYHCDVILVMTSRAYYGGARGPRSHYDVILIATPFATELATPTVTDVRT